MKRLGLARARALLACVLFLALAPMLSAQRATVRTPKGIARVTDSLLRADSVRHDVLQRIQHTLDSIRADSVRRALRPAEREAATAKRRAQYRCAFAGADDTLCLARIRDSLDRRLAALEQRFAEARRDSAAIPGGWQLVGTSSARSLATAPRGASGLTASRYALLAGGVLAYNAACPFGRSWCERDPGGYTDEWKSPDKYGHALGAMAVTSLAMQSGVSPWRAFAVTNVAGVGFELTQAIGGGYVSGWDLAWNAGGALLPVVWRKVWR